MPMALLVLPLRFYTTTEPKTGVAYGKASVNLIYGKLIQSVFIKMAAPRIG